MADGQLENNDRKSMVSEGLPIAEIAMVNPATAIDTTTIAWYPGKAATLPRRQSGLERLIRAFLGRYAVAMLITAGLHAALFLAPSTKTKPSVAQAAPEELELFLSSPQGAEDGSTTLNNPLASHAPDESGPPAPPLTMDELASVAQQVSAEWQTTPESLHLEYSLDPAAFVMSVAGVGIPGPITWGASGNASGSGSGFGTGTGMGQGRGTIDGMGNSWANTSNHLRQNASFLFAPNPIYPEAARRERRQGAVELNVMVDPSGRASTAAIGQSSGHRDLDEAARHVVLQQWRFQKSNTQSPREYTVRITFDLTM